MARGKFKGNSEKRDGKHFVALPMVVLDSPGYRRASCTARGLLIDIAMQYTGHNNGKLTSCAKYLGPLGWRSNDTIVRARRELIDCGLLIETRKGARPNKAAWFALPWLDLDQGNGLDIEPKLYRRGAYMTPEKPARTRASVIPNGGTVTGTIAPISGVRASILAPANGAIRATQGPSPAPPDGTYLEIPSGKGFAADVSPVSPSHSRQVPNAP